VFCWFLLCSADFSFYSSSENALHVDLEILPVGDEVASISRTLYVSRLMPCACADLFF
jgi:hypothetical protein